MWSLFSELHRATNNAILTNDPHDEYICRTKLQELCEEFLHIETRAVCDLNFTGFDVCSHRAQRHASLI